MSNDLINQIDSEGFLDLRESNLSRINLSTLRGCASLRKLDLSENNLKQIDIAHLGPCSNLDEILTDELTLLIWNGSLLEWQKESHVLKKIRSESIRVRANIDGKKGQRGRTIVLDSILPESAKSFQLSVNPFENRLPSSSFHLSVQPTENRTYYNLQHLWLGCSTIGNGNYQYKEIFLSALASLCPNLISLGIAWPLSKLRTAGNFSFSNLEEFELGTTLINELDLSFLRKTKVKRIGIRYNRRLKHLDMTPLLYCSALEEFSNGGIIGSINTKEISLVSRKEVRERVLPIWKYLDDESQDAIESYLRELKEILDSDALATKEATVDSKVSIILEGIKQMERTAKSFIQFDEEPLRDTLLLKLPEATGETFTRKGHSDIFIPLGNYRFLIAECKIWKGKKKYQKGFEDQLLNYLTHRDEHCVYITFVKRSTFTRVLKIAMKTAQDSGSFVSGTFQEIDKGYFITEHSHPSDPDARTTMHHILVNLIL